MLKKLFQPLNYKRHNFVLQRVAELMTWIETKLASKQKKYILKRLTPWQKNIIKRLLSPSKRHARLRFEILKARLYNLGFTKRSLADMKNMYAYPETPFMKKLAAWELSLWHANLHNEEGARKCLDLLPDAVKGEKDFERLYRASLLEAECNKILGKIHEAKQTIFKAMKTKAHPDLFLAAANLEPPGPNRIIWFNKVFQLYGLSQISLDTSVNLPLYNCLTCKQDRQNTNVANDLPKVSILIPAWNAESVIHTTLDSLLCQTWDHMEVIIVDDCSTDTTVEIVREYSKRDDRIQLMLSESKAGPYAARNHALKMASGDFVIVNDMAEWSHPEKIERQVQHLLDNPSVIANTSRHVWSNEDLQIFRWRNTSCYIATNMTSLMFRREPVMKTIGYWDCVQFGADAEFIQRLKKVFGNDAVVDLPELLSFLIKYDGSRLEKETTGYYEDLKDARKEYYESYSYFHATSETLYYEYHPNSRPFPVPEIMLRSNTVKERRCRHFDVILASDFRLVGGSTISNVEEIKAQKKAGLSTGLIQMARYDVDPTKAVNFKIRELIDGDRVQMLVYGEKVSCDVLILRYPPILHEWQRFIPNVEAKDIRVIVNQPPMSDYGPNAVLRYDIKQCQQHIQEYFGKGSIWHPIGPLVRKALYEHHAEDLKHIKLSDEDWSNIIDVNEWRRSTRPKHKRIRIGRHSRDHEVKWPSNRKELLSIYPDTDAYEIYILGGARTPLSILKYRPKNWQVFEFGEVHPKDFLSNIDVFVYYTHPNWVESFGRVIIEAMAVGVPVILPHAYRELFGEAAIYADPSEVQGKISQLMDDDGQYESQVEKANAYIEKHFGYSKHISRLMKDYIRDS